MIGMVLVGLVLAAMAGLSVYRSVLERRSDAELAALLPDFPVELGEDGEWGRMTDAGWLPERICDALRAWARVGEGSTVEVWIDAREADKPREEVDSLVRVIEHRMGTVVVIKVVDGEDDPQGAVALCEHLAHYVWPLTRGRAPDWACQDPEARAVARALRTAVLEGAMRRSLMADTPGRPILYDLSQRIEA